MQMSIYARKSNTSRKRHTWYSNLFSFKLHPAVSTETSASRSTNDLVLFSILTSGEVFIYVHEGQETLHTRQWLSTHYDYRIYFYWGRAIGEFFYGHLFTKTSIMCLWEVRGKRMEKKGRNKGERELKFFRVASMTSLSIIDRVLIYWLLIGCGEEKEGKIG